MRISYSVSALFISLGAALLLFALSAPVAQAQLVSFETEEGWGLQVTGDLPVFLVGSSHEDFSADGGDEFATRVMSGFNPGNVTFTIDAPTQNGIDVSAVFQINHHLQGPGVQNAGLFEGRIADIVVAGDFGTFNIGKGFGIFNATALGDEGSTLGVGRFLGPDDADATLGRIGTGYTYANFNPRITYTTPDLGGLSLRLGMINPENPAAPGVDADQIVETRTPRFEGQLDYTVEHSSGSFLLWAGGLYQDVNVTDPDFNYDMTGWDVGGRLDAAGFGLSGTFSQTNGIGADGLIGLNLNGSGLDQATVDATQWYVEGTYDINRFTVGASYGEGDQDAVTTSVGSAPEIKNQMFMWFARFGLTDHLILISEFQYFESDAQNDYVAFILGSQVTF